MVLQRVVARGTNLLHLKLHLAVMVSHLCRLAALSCRHCLGELLQPVSDPKAHEA
jgi:hypothetical protein